MPWTTKDVDSNVRICAINALQNLRIQNAEVILALKNVLNDEAEKVRAVAQRALAELEPSKIDYMLTSRDDTFLEIAEIGILPSKNPSRSAPLSPMNTFAG